jgi:SAM-dependent methyltransferase
MLVTAGKPLESLTELDRERAQPSRDPYQAVWHMSRYLFAARWAIGKRVFDAGSGVGYGSAMLADVAESVIGVDYSPVAVEHASSTFEVIEHLDDQAGLLEALANRLADGGRIILSTPNRAYHGGLESNPYHVRELEPRQLRRLVGGQFRHVRLLGQLDRAEVPRACVKLGLDPLYLRRRIRPQRLVDESSAAGSSNREPSRIVVRPPREIVFSRLLARVAPIVIATAAR